MALLLSQHKIIEWLTDKLSRHTRLTIESVPNKAHQHVSIDHIYAPYKSPTSDDCFEKNMQLTSMLF